VIYLFVLLLFILIVSFGSLEIKVKKKNTKNNIKKNNTSTKTKELNHKKKIN
jgi:hypothetical protein